MSADGLARVWMRLRLLVGRGRNTQVDDSRGAQTHQVRLGADELRDDTPRVAEYGFVSNPPPGTDVIVVFIAGERTNGVIVGTNNQTLRMRSLASGEVAIHDDKGRFVYLSDAGIHVQGKDSPILVETTSDITATAGGDILLKAAGTIKLQAPTVDIETTTLIVNAQTITTTATSTTTTADTIAITAEVGVTGPVDVTGALGVEGATTIVGATSITGAMTNNGHDVGNAHEHLAGGLHIGGSSVAGVSGGVTP